MVKVVKVLNYSYGNGNDTFRFGPLSAVVCLSLALIITIWGVGTLWTIGDGERRSLATYYSLPLGGFSPLSAPWKYYMILLISGLQQRRSASHENFQFFSSVSLSVATEGAAFVTV